LSQYFLAASTAVEKLKLYRQAAALATAPLGGLWPAPVTIVNDGKPLSAELLQEGVAFVRAHQEQGGIVLVACGAGISRAATFATAVLKETEGLTLREAFHEVQRSHPDAMPHMALWNSLCRYYDEPIPWIEIA
jgi:hypothetical protein